jgi:hypothetical protein
MGLPEQALSSKVQASRQINSFFMAVSPYCKILAL